MLLGSLKWNMDGNHKNLNFLMRKDQMIKCYFVQQLKVNIHKSNLYDINIKYFNIKINIIMNLNDNH